MERKVFISYSSKNRDIVDSIYPALEDSGIPCWIAPRDIKPGSDYAGSIVEAIRECEMILLIFSEGSNGSPQVKREIDRGVSLGKDIVAVRIDDTRPTGSMEYYLSPVHWFDCCLGLEDENLNVLPELVRERLISRRGLKERASYKLGKGLALSAAYGDSLRSSILDDQRFMGILGLQDTEVYLRDPSHSAEERSSQMIHDHEMIMSDHKGIDNFWFDLGMELASISILSYSENNNEMLQDITQKTLERLDREGLSGSKNLQIIYDLLKESPSHDMENLQKNIISLDKSMEL